jgi:uncharacterized membrane protein HdeD (DUF308 family)
MLERSLDVRNWWVFVIRGLAAIAFGIATWLMPGMALLTLALLFGAYAVADGISAFAAAFSVRTEAGERPRWPLVLHAVVSVLVGLIAILVPGVTVLALLLLIAARAIVTGTLEMVAAIRLRKEISGEWLLAVSGALSVAFGVFLFVFPGPGALGLLLWIGAYAIVVGVLLVALGFRLRSVKRRVFGEGGPSAGRFAGSH